MMGFSALRIRGRDQSSVSLTHLRNSVRKQLSTAINSISSLILDLPASRPVGKKRLLFKPAVYSILL